MGLIAGEQVPLGIQLADNVSYPRATVLGPNNQELPGSPVALPLIAKMAYGTSGFVMPNYPWIRVIYEVFTDPAFTTPSTIYGNSSEVFLLDQSGGGGGGETTRITYIVGELIGEIKKK